MLAAGAALWVLLAVLVYCLPAMLGVGVSFHYFTDTIGGYFTDTIGGLLLGTAIVCLAALTLGRAPHRT